MAKPTPSCDLSAHSEGGSLRLHPELGTHTGEALVEAVAVRLGASTENLLRKWEHFSF